MKVINKSLLLLLFCASSFFSYSQEMLVDLTSNQQLGAWEEAARRHANAGRAVGDTLSLPFFDDFSEPFSRLHHPHDLYPSLDRWIGNTVYVNNHMAINPLSQGVATFDGLDENGLAYGFGFTTPTLSDSLTSKPIDLSTATDSVYLSFYYQAQGLGNAPEEDDLLALEFKDSAETWFRIWDTQGYILEDYLFNRVMIPVTGGQYLHSGFQFRFLNYASRAGNVDHWHVDYIELDESRSYADTLVNDLAFVSQTSVDFEGNTVSQTSSIIKEYNSMPWTHFKDNPAAYMGDTSYLTISNNTYQEYSGDHTLRIYDINGTLLHISDTASPVVRPHVVCGSEINNCDDNDPGSPVQDNFGTILDYELPTSPELSPDSSFFLVVHQIENLVDDVATNDKIATRQEFFNYYAYDDGTAEVAYGLGNLENEGKVGVRYDIKKADSLQAIQIYLNPVDQDLTEEPVKLMIWSGPSEPDGIIYESPEFITLSYSEGQNYFYNYELEDAIWIEPGIIWVGWTQQAATGVKFSVGFDRRTNVAQKVFYNLGSSWNQSSIPGAVMIRPTFGRPYNWVSGVEETSTEGVTIYPNPSTGMLYLKESFRGQLKDATVRILDLSGRMAYNQGGYTESMDVSHLTAGTYLVQIDTKLGATHTQRVVIQP